MSGHFENRQKEKCRVDLRNYFEMSCLDTKTEIELDGGGCGSILVNFFFMDHAIINRKICF